MRALIQSSVRCCAIAVGGLACSAVSSPSQAGGGGALDAATHLDAESEHSEGATESGSPESSDSGSNCTQDGDAACSLYRSCADLSSPSISFASVILPLFEMSCGAGGAACHGTPNAPKSSGQVYLGGAAASPQQVLASIVGQASAENPQMDEVTAGDPGQSWLMHKLDGDQCMFDTACNATGNSAFANCGFQQPYNGTPLDAATRDTIRRWIAQGALDN